MARKPNSSAEAAPLTAVRIKQGIDRLRRRIEELERFDPTSVKERWAPETKAIQAAIDDTLTGIFGQKATILHLQPNAGKTIIEKFEKHGMAAGFAVVVVTPDDLGGPSPSDLKPRARQNVIGEMFWFAGRLGRDRVCVLIKDEVEMPSDIAGFGYTPLDAHGGWKNKLLQELDAAGYKNLDWKAALV